MSKQLHIVNGDIVGHKLKESGVDGDVLVWREMLYDGPLTVLPFPDLLEQRALYFEQELGVSSALFQAGCRKQEQQLQRLGDYREVTLWFEHDLFDQTIFLYLFHRLNSHAIGNQTQLSYLTIDSHPGYTPFHGLGQLQPDELASLWRQREDLHASIIAEGAAWWQAYADSSPDKLVELLDEKQSKLPISRNAMKFHLERYPSMGNGLSPLENKILRAVDSGVQEPKQLFAHLFAKDTRYGLGDLSFWAYLNRMRGEKHPLLAWNRNLSLPTYNKPELPTDLKIELTEWGRKVIEGQLNRIELNGVDRWLGGTHLRLEPNVG